jgi:RNA polymerase sigma-70 factor, ECF subfamily
VRTRVWIDPAPHPTQQDGRRKTMSITTPAVALQRRTHPRVAEPTVRCLDPAALGDHLDRLYRAAIALCRSREDAEDVVQDTCARVLALPRVLRADDDLGYLLRALRHTFYNRVRDQRRRPVSVELTSAALEVLATGERQRPDAALANAEALRLVGELPPRYGAAVVAVDLVGLSYPQAARALRTRIGTVRSRLHRGRQALAATLDPA